MSRLKINEEDIDLLKRIGRDVMYCLHMSFYDLLNTINTEDGDNYVLVGSVSKRGKPFCVSEISEAAWDDDSCNIGWALAVPVQELPRSAFV